jgi:hypothetical protein
MMGIAGGGVELRLYLAATRPGSNQERRFLGRFMACLATCGKGKVPSAAAKSILPLVT